MRGEERADRQLLDAAALVGHLVPEGSVFAFLAEHRARVFPPELFADLFPASTGRPSLPGAVAASVLQALHDLSGRDAVAAVRCDLRWKVACGLSLDHEGFHPTTLTYWRWRLAASGPDLRGTPVAVITATGVLAGKARRALDSVVLEDAVATQDTVTHLIAAIRRAGREVPGAAAVIVARCRGHDYADPGKPAIAWDDKAARDALVSALVTGATTVTGAFRRGGPGRQGRAGAGLAGADRRAGRRADRGQRRYRRPVADPPHDRLRPGDLYRRPGGPARPQSQSQRQDGYKAHVAIEPDTGLFTGGRLTKASGEQNHAAVIGLGLLAGENAGPLEVLGDTAYGPGSARTDLAAAGHTAVIKPGPLQSAVPGGFTIDDFTFDQTSGTVTCPVA
jgi:transposase-like protein DUF772